MISKERWLQLQLTPRLYAIYLTATNPTFALSNMSVVLHADNLPPQGFVVGNNPKVLPSLSS